jgi:hypothetical protein
MKTEPRIPVGEPMSPCDRTRGGVACAMSVMREKFPGVVPVASAMDSRASESVGADWIVDIYFVPLSDAAAFEDFADDLSVSLADALGVQVVLISHTEEATHEYYMDKLRSCCAFEVANRSRDNGVLIGTPSAGERLPMWSFVDVTEETVVEWDSFSVAHTDEIRKAA